MLGAASGAVAGLVAITPACGFVGPMGAIIIGLIAGLVCLWGVSGLKRMLGADDSLDVFGVHGVGGIVGALLTGVFAAHRLGGTGIFDYVANMRHRPDYSIGGQVWVQFQAVATTIVWSAVVSYIAYKLVDMIIGLRVSEETSAKAWTSAHTAKAPTTAEWPTRASPSFQRPAAGAVKDCAPQAQNISSIRLSNFLQIQDSILD
jgi:ammonia channel protein AmtB